MVDDVALRPRGEAQVRSAEHYFADRMDLAVRYAGHLGTSGIERGLIGPRELERLWERHLLNCAAVSSEIPAGSTVVDVGSGAGLPGLVLAIARPDLTVVLLEPLLRRVTWLGEVVGDLGIGSVRVVRGRAEEWAEPFLADVVTARAVAALPRLAGWCLPLLRSGGAMLALKGESAEQELVDAVPELRQLGASSWEVRVVGEEWLGDPTRVVRVVRGGGRSGHGHPSRPTSPRSRKST